MAHESKIMEQEKKNPKNNKRKGTKKISQSTFICFDILTERAKFLTNFVNQKCNR